MEVYAVVMQIEHGHAVLITRPGELDEERCKSLAKSMNECRTLPETMGHHRQRSLNYEYTVKKFLLKAKGEWEAI